METPRHSWEHARGASACLRDPLYACRIGLVLGLFLEVNSDNFNVLETSVGFKVIEHVDHVLIDMQRVGRINYQLSPPARSSKAPLECFPC